MKITHSQVPSNSILHNSNYDYVDSFKGYSSDKEKNITSKEIGKAFFQSAPKWSLKLFELRNKIVSQLGLKVEETPKNINESLDNFQCNPGDQLGLFKVYEKNDNEVILGQDDKHLDFRISIFKEDYKEQNNTIQITISTTVNFHNKWGEIYFLLVKPFHKLIVPKMLEGIINNLENN